MAGLVEEVQRDAELISRSDHSMDLKRYVESWLPLHYPNKGILYMARKGAKFEVYHEEFDLPSFLQNASGQVIETVIDHYGSTHQRDYCLVVLGHRFQGPQVVQFRGILGQHRLYKVLLLLRLAGIPEYQIILYDKSPDYRAIISRDLAPLSGQIDHIVFGGEVIVKPFLSSAFNPLSSCRGEIVSWTIFQYGAKKMLFTSYPYGDLSEHVVEALSSKIGDTITFVGCAGSLTADFLIGSIIVPADIYSDSSLITANFPNYLIDRAGKIQAKVSGKHLSVKTPLAETTSMLADLKRHNFSSIDVETAHFQRGCEKYLDANIHAGVMLFVSDHPGSDSDLSRHDYSSAESLDTRQHLARIVEELQEDISTG